MTNSTRSRYSALCVGGPYAGKFVESQTPIFSVCERPEIPLVPVDYDSLCAAEMHMKRVEYVLRALPVGGAEFLMFIPADWTDQDAVNELFEAYSMYEDLKQ